MFFWKENHIVESEVEEELNHSPLKVSGQIPEWLSGTLIRNGPVEIAIDGKTTGHWLDGLAMLHAFSFNQGQVFYTNRFLHTNAYSQVFTKGCLDYPRFAVDPCRSLFKWFSTYLALHSPSYLQNANVNVAKIADRFVALTETPLPVEFDSDTLETLGVFNYPDKLPKQGSWESAHPHQTKENTWNYCIQYGQTSSYILYFLRKNETTRNEICRIPVENPAYMHSFSLTENYVILTEFPYTVKPLPLLINTNIKGKAFINNFSWHPEKGTTFIVVDRHTGRLKGKYTTKPFFAFHHINAYENKDEIYLDIVCYDDPQIIQGLANHFSCTLPRINENQFSTRLERFRLSFTHSQIQSEVIFSDFIEFPRINENFDGKVYQFAYLIDPRQETSPQDVRPIYKINTQNKQALQWSEKGCYPGEPIFVANPSASKEDEGIILSVVFDKKMNRSFLLSLDAKTMQETGRSFVQHKVPVGLHGQYFPRSSHNAR